MVVEPPYEKQVIKMGRKGCEQVLVSDDAVNCPVVLGKFMLNPLGT